MAAASAFEPVPAYLQVCRDPPSAEVAEEHWVFTQVRILATVRKATSSGDSYRGFLEHLGDILDHFDAVRWVRHIDP